MKKIKVGLIGAGSITRKHLDVIKDIDDIEAVAITSRTRKKAENLASEYGIAICVDSLDSLIKEAQLDALMVLVSADQIYEVTSKAIPYGLPLFIEKPPGLTPSDTKKLAALAKEHSVPNMVGFNRRFYSIFAKGLEIIRAHGPLLGVEIQGHERMWLRAARLSEKDRYHWIFSNSTHTIDLLRFFGGEPESISSLAHKYIEPRGDQFSVQMELNSGAIGHYSAYWYSPGGWSVVLYGYGVTVEYKPLEAGRWTDKNFVIHDIEPDEVDRAYKPGFFRQMQAFIKLVRNRVSQWPMLDLEGAYKTMALAEQMSSNVSDKREAINSQTKTI